MSDWKVVEKLYVVRIYTNTGSRKMHELTWTSRARARTSKAVLSKSPIVERIEILEQETRQRRAR